MEKSYFIALIILLTTFSLTAQNTLKPDKPTASYNLGETAQFQFFSNQSGTVEYEFFYDTKTPIISSGTLPTTGGAILNIPFTLNEPGVVFCRVKLNQITIEAAATFEPFAIAAFEPEPADLDAFWQNAKNELAAVPIDPQVTFLQNNTYSTTYRVNLANIGNRRVYGYLTVPNGNGPFPAIIKFPPFGTLAGLAGIGEQVAENSGALYFSMNIHNVEPDQEDPNAYVPDNLDDLNQFYFKYAALAGMRVMDYLMTRPDFDQQHFGVYGESQGGGLAIMVASLDDRVDVLMNSNPTHCQNLGAKYGKATGFGYFLDNFAPNNQQQNVKYFDNVYLAKRFQGVSWSFISYEDRVCPAATTFAAINQLNGQKTLTHSIDLGHNHPAQFWNDQYAFFRRHLPTAKPSNPFINSDQSHFINAGVDQAIPSGAAVTLSATIEKDNVVNPSYQLNWTKVSGPGTVTFNNNQNYTTTANFSQEGTYTLRFVAEDQGLINNNPPQYFTYMDEVTITVGNCVDNDNDGVCANTDCDDANPNLPGVAGATCDDGDANTENDVIQADGCTCAGTPIMNCIDADNDGVCFGDDCDDNNPNLPASTGTICDDGNANTENDVIQGDGCTCQGTLIIGGNPNVCEVQITTGDGSITVTGMDEPNFRLQIFNQYWSEIYYECFWTNCPDTKTIHDLATGTYVVKVQSFNASWVGVCDFIEYPMVINNGGGCIDADNDGICLPEDCNDNNPNLPATAGTSCDDGDANTENDAIQSDGCTCAGTPIVVCTDADNDGICLPQDCNDNDPNLPAVEGTSCDDGNVNTENDAIQSDGCTCTGTPIVICTDADNDGICLPQDCNDNDPNLPAAAGTGCDDGNVNTENDVIQSDGCTCTGTPINTGEPSCSDIQLDGSNGQITISGLTAPIEIIRVRNSQWQQIFECVANCEEPIVLPNLSAGNYPVQIQMYTQGWSPICVVETMVAVTGNSSLNRNTNLEKSPQIALFPNPAKEEVFLNLIDFQGENIQLKIINQLGKVIVEKNDFKVENGIKRIDLQSFVNGLYFVQVEARGKRIAGKRLVVNRLY